MCNALGDQKRALDPMELELQAVVSCHAGAGKPGPLQEQTVLLTVNLFLQSQSVLDLLRTNQTVFHGLDHYTFPAQGFIFPTSLPIFPVTCFNRYVARYLSVVKTVIWWILVNIPYSFPRAED